MGVTSFTGFIWTWELTRQTRVELHMDAIK